MHVNCNREDLLKGLQIIQSVVATKSTLPVLTNLLIETEKERIKIVGTDLEVGMKCNIKADVVKEGGVTIPARKLIEIVREAPLSEIEIISEEGSKVTVKSGNYLARLMGIPKEEYPSLPEFKESSTLSIHTDVMAEMIRKTIFSVSTDETRYVLCGIYFICDKKTIKMVSTDGRRLSYIEKEADSSKIKDKNLIIPTKAINELNKIISQISGTIKIGIGDNQIGFKLESILLISRLIEGTYPNYDQVIPKNSEIKLKLNREKFLNSTKRVAVLTSDKSSSIRYTLKDNNMTITANTQGLGEAKDELPVDFNHEEIAIAYNPNYIIDVLKNIDSEEVYLEITNSLNPGLIRPADNSNYLAVIMPMRI